MIYRITLFLAFVCSSALLQAQDLKPTDDSALVTFIVSDYESIPEAGAVVLVKSTDNTITKKGTSDIDGKFAVRLAEGKTYTISVVKFGENFPFDEPFEIPSKPGLIVFDYKIKIRVVTKYIRSYALENVYFDSNKWDIKKECIPALDNLYKAMTANPKMKIEIAGHTDDVGAHEDNLHLSQKRSDAVMNYLIQKGIASNRVIAKGYGEMKPIAPNDNEQGRIKNRRTEIKIIEE